MKQLAIHNIATTVFRLPMHGTLRWGKHSSLAEACHALVRVTLSDGSTGVAEATPRPTIYGETTDSIASVIRHELAPRLVDVSIDCTGLRTSNTPQQAIQQALHEVKNNHTAKGAIDIAVHDALAQHRELSLAEHVGADANDKIKVSYILGIGDRNTVLAEAERVFQAGVRVLKVKVGRNWDDDIARILELQQLLGTEMSLYADANECLTMDEAPKKLDQLHELGVLYCEEPLPVEQIQDRAILRQGNHIPLIADDSTFTVRDLRRELMLDTFDILNIKTARTGYSESYQMVQMVQPQTIQEGKGIMVGSQASTGIGTARAAIFAGLHEIAHPSELSFFLKVKEDIVVQALPITDGYVCVADACATQIDEDLLRDAMIEHQEVICR
ncbi:MAG: enolase C-terminal domain-like protein [Chloroflexota bacterium]